MEEQTANLAQKLARYYGGAVTVEYIDVLSPRMADFPLLQRVVFGMGYNLPIVAFEGQPKIAGGISIEMISEELEKRGLVVPTAPAE